MGVLSSKKKAMALLLVLAMLFSLLPVWSASAAAYGDTGGHWAADSIQRWSDRGLLAGYNSQFRPDDGITRGEMAAILNRVMQYQTKAANQFGDLADDAWYADSILRLNAAGVMVGSAGQVNPETIITRQETAALLCKVFRLTEVSGQAGFADDSKIAPWAMGAVKAMKDAGYLSGVGGNSFDPSGVTTRAQLVAMLDKMVSAIYSEQGSYTASASQSVVINASGVTLANATIAGDLYIAPGVGQGDVQLDNVTVEGKIHVLGGGENTVRFNSVTAYGGIAVKKDGGDIRVIVSGSSNISVVVLESGAILVSREGDPLPVVISDLVGPGETVTLDGNFSTVTNQAANATIKATGSIERLILEQTATVSGGARIERVTTAPSAQSVVNGQTIAGGQTDIRPPAGGGGGGSSSGGGGGTTPPATTGAQLEISRYQSAVTFSTTGSALQTTSSALEITDQVIMLNAGQQADGSYSRTITLKSGSDLAVRDNKVYLAKMPENQSVSVLTLRLDKAGDSASRDITVTVVNTSYVPLSGADQEAAKYQTKVTIPLDTALDSDVTSQVTLLKAGETADSGYRLSYEVVAGGDCLAVTDNKVYLRKLAEVEKPLQAVLALTVSDGQETATVQIAVTIAAPGWQEPVVVDERFADGYPNAYFDGSSLKIDVKLKDASENNPVEMFMIVNTMNGHVDADVISVLHGHTGVNDKNIQVDNFPYLRITDTDVHTIDGNITVDGNHDIKIATVLKDRASTSQTPTLLHFDARTVAALDVVAPRYRAAYINQDRDMVYVHFDGKLTTDQVPAASAFTLSGVSGAGIQQVTVANVAAKGSFVDGYVGLAVTGLTAQTDIDSLRISYTAPAANALQDANGNQCDNLSSKSVQDAAVKPEKAYISEDGRYIHLSFEKSPGVWSVDGRSVTVSQGGKTLDYEVTDSSFSNAGWNGECYLYSETDPAKSSDGLIITIDFSGAESYAFDPVGQVVFDSSHMQQADQALSITEASYNLTDQVLMVQGIGNLSEQGISSCNFVLKVNGTDHRLRGRLHGSGVGDGLGFGLRIDAENIPAAISAGDTLILTYQSAHQDDRFILRDESGKPCAAQTDIPVTIQ